VTEILDRLRVLTASLTSPDLLAKLVESLPDALVVVDEGGLVILFNEQAELLFGYHRSEVLGKAVEILVPEAARELHIKHRAGFVAEPRNRPMGLGLNLSGRHKNGSEFPVQINLSPVQTPDGLFVSAVIRKKRA